MVVLVPVPIVVTPPGVLVNVHVPDEGKLFNTALPDATVHVGCVMVTTVGVAGVDSEALIITLVDVGETHPDALVTV
jgi:hypothetical protein